MVNIKYGNNYHIKNDGQIIEIIFTDGNTLYKQTVQNNRVEENLTVDFCEEKFLLNDGKTLKRTRDNLLVVD